ncbi:TetR/AcrR family transcriptional regulator [Streptomyces sp. WAC05374]|uniref:TetR/AcrR family transcriptional regulator n=1 Tax=Streptomyces sp. WAC05374 TaxID=2487420 RepID=UPI000F88C5F4|nr:TetR/AcrR family transcriptional regulator [Streptomyces sp. WAC05374]RST10092.1 TetR/AcrR family transcriptional regulator [Streptomyces sp. WAC05374]TDF42951.1 TetR/AcrR family transcriptional regulator [Streptomyces sp. WAC05374]TDF47793.1 TetR/AcrR family transcriptional regulator [Streptomyces sp. WAC05374]TDF48935.1 TetR/AcrR family transcriptional regulator [Streptomyces sp. WAC05374]
MPTAREALLNAATAALAALPWPAIRMVDVASAAGVSRQTLYNEFGSKEGLARALVRREADAYLYGVEGALRARSDATERLVSVAEWTVGEAYARPLLRALLTGCWGDRLPAPRPAPVRHRAPAGPPAQRRADGGAPEPGELVAAVRERSRTALGQGNRGGEAGGDGTGDDALEAACEVAVRLALSYVVAPGPGDVGSLLRRVLSATSPTTGGR